MVEEFPSSGASLVVPLVVRGLTVSSPERTLLRDIDFSVQTGQVLCLTGPSGAGKTTLLRCLNRLVDLSSGLRVSGQVWIEGEEIFSRSMNPDRLRQRVGMLFQQPVIFPGSIEHNVAFGLQGRGRSRAHRIERALREAALWDEVKDRLRETASLLSVGQQQRLCLARTLALDPQVLLMDEPTSALDPESTRRIEELILSLKAGRAIVVVTHAPAQAERLADAALHLTLRDGVGVCTTESEKELSGSTLSPISGDDVPPAEELPEPWVKADTAAV